MTTSFVLGGILGVLAIVAALDVARQYYEALGLFRYLRRESKSPRAADSTLPKAAVVLALRGPDPRLPETFHALLEQNYPDFVIQLVVDSEHDPVLRDVAPAMEKSSRMRMSILKNPAIGCSLKCSSLIQAVKGLDEDVKLLAFIDGDVVPHANWLRDLASPIVDGRADVTGGNRWYLPPDSRMGSMVRYFWNAGFMREMWNQGAPWAGTMAMTRTTIDEIGLLDAWQSAMSVDATLHRCLNQHQKRFRLIPSLLMVNRESISLRQFHTWVTRQMAVVRYTASHTVRSVQVHILTLLFLHLLLAGLSLLAFAIGEPRLGSLAVAVLSAYWMLLAAGAGVQEIFLRKTLNQRGEPVQWMTPLKLLAWCPGMVLTHWVLVFGVLESFRIKEVNWRGIRYRLMNDGAVQIADYKPFTAKWNPADHHSVV